MKVIQLQDVLHEYLVHVLLTYHAHPTEGVGIANLWEAVTKNVTHIDDAQVKAMAAAGAPPPPPDENPNSPNAVVER
jgi:imidazolonepropionase-like amidohydrolase